MDIKPGWKTSEFLVTVLVAVGSIAVALGFAEQSQVDNIVQAVSSLAAAVAAVVAAVVPVVEYIKSRTAIKQR